ncbi:nuclear transport factor 2 family protein [Pontibacter rugosus]|uniref:Nuclear transport factor 2 family protein n=1 Tax=Pontibacter rugosus TaxID=1745966 RepID=A0ABW3SX06_9BACT
MSRDLHKRQAIENYIKAYNAFDVAGMVQGFDANVVFENISEGEVNLKTEGIAAFKQQAEQAKLYFKEREQQVDSITIIGETVEASINYRGVLAVDFPNGMKAGDVLQLQGKSIFYFEAGKIVKLQDIS